MKKTKAALGLILCLLFAGIISCSSAMVMFAKGVNAVMQMNQKFDDFKDVKDSYILGDNLIVFM